MLEPIGERTGYSLPVIEYALDRLFESLTVEALQAAIAGELGTLDVLDVPQPRARGVRTVARPLGRACVISSRTTIGVALPPALFALCAKCDVLVKDREDGLARAFFASLAEELDELGPAAQAASWDGERDAADLRAFDVVAAFGSDTTVARIAAACAPARFIGFGSKASIGYVSREALCDDARAEAVAAGAARDLVLYDSEGCLSLHALFVEEGGAVSVARFCELLARAVERAVVEFPLGARDAQTAARLASARDLATFRRANGIGGVYCDAAATYLAVLDPPAHEPPAFLPRGLAVRTVASTADALAYLHAHDVPVEAIAVAAFDENVLGFADAVRANRIARFGELQHPRIDGYHGGRTRIADFVRWVSIEA